MVEIIFLNFAHLETFAKAKCQDLWITFLRTLQIRNCCSMDLITELESEFSALSTSTPVVQLAVRISNETINLRFPELGNDYLCGVVSDRILVFPIGRVTEILGSALPEVNPRSMIDFLSAQRTPVRVSYRTAEQSGSCWLLNVRAGWIRVSMTKGVSWLPLAAISRLEILAVDN